MDKTAAGMAAFALMLTTLELLQEKKLLTEAENHGLLVQASEAAEKLGKKSRRLGSKDAASILSGLAKHHRKRSQMQR